MLINGCLADSFENLSPYLNDFRYDCDGARLSTPPVGCIEVESVTLFRPRLSTGATVLVNLKNIDFIYELPFMDTHYSVDSVTRRVYLKDGDQVGNTIYITDSVTGSNTKLYVLGDNIRHGGVIVSFGGSTVGLEWDGTEWFVTYWGEIQNQPPSQSYIEKVTYLDGNKSATYNPVLRLYGVSNFVYVYSQPPGDSDYLTLDENGLAVIDNTIYFGDLSQISDQSHKVLFNFTEQIDGPATVAARVVAVPEDTRYSAYEFTATDVNSQEIDLDSIIDGLSPWFRLVMNLGLFSELSRDALMVNRFQISFINTSNGFRDNFPLSLDDVSKVFWMRSLDQKKVYTDFADSAESADFTLESDGKVYPSENGSIFNLTQVIVHYE